MDAQEPPVENGETSDPEAVENSGGQGAPVDGQVIAFATELSSDSDAPSTDVECESDEVAEPAIGSDAEVSRSDLVMVKQAIKHRWPIDPEKRPRIIRALEQMATSKRYTPRERLGAARALLAADRLNQEDELAAAGRGRGLTVNVGIGITSEQRQAALRDDPEYLEWLERRTLERDAGTVCEVSEREEMETCQTSLPHLQGSDGFGNGPTAVEHPHH